MMEFIIHEDYLDEELTSVSEELVRCKDCQYYVDECCDRYADETLGYVHSTQPDFFCAVAERKEE